MERPTQKYDPRLLGLGLVAGAVLGAVWINSKQRQYARQGAPKLINWQRVGNMARQIVHEEDVTSGWHEQWKEYYQNMVARCYPVITSEIGRELPVPLDKIDAFTRNEWIDANIANFKLLFEPIESIYYKVQGPGNFGTVIMGDLNQTVLSSEVGVLLGYLARRVLGQYDLSLLGKEPVTTGRSIS